MLRGVEGRRPSTASCAERMAYAAFVLSVIATVVSTAKTIHVHRRPGHGLARALPLQRGD
jgi:hypothetical protein